MTIVFQKSILKSKAAKRIVADAKLTYFKEKVLEHLDALEAKERKKEQAVQKALLWEETLRKAAYPVGTVREWKGKKYIKTAPGKWRRKYDKEGKGAKLAITALKKKVDACKTSEELLQLVLEHSSRFRDENGHPLPFVQELSEYVSKANDEIVAGKRGTYGHAAKLRNEFNARTKPLIGKTFKSKDGHTVEFTQDSQDKIRSSTQQTKENGFTVEEHFEAANQIKHLFESASLVKWHDDYKHGDKNLKIGRFLSGEITLNSGKKAKVCITVKHTLDKNKKAIYSIEGMEITDALAKTRAKGYGQDLNIKGDLSSANNVSQTGSAVKQETQKNAGKRGAAETPDELAQQFGLRGVEIGGKVSPKVAQWHVKKCSESFADLADITGIPDKLVSLNGRLSLAIGARDKRNTYAHYSTGRQAININKTKGAGSLAHEWFHAFDNLLASAMGEEDVSGNSFMTEDSISLLGLPRKECKALIKYMNAEDEATRAAALEECKALNISNPEKKSEEHQIRVMAAFDSLVSAMTKSENALPATIEYGEKDVDDARKLIYKDAPLVAGEIYSAGNFEEATKVILDRFDRDFARERWLTIAAAYYLEEPKGGETRKVSVQGVRQESAFLAAAEDLEYGGGRYWSPTREMAARAFAAYIKDKLAEQGRRNDYLTRDDNDERKFPQGEERKRINAAFDRLFRVIAETNAIRKALKTTAKKKRWLWVEDGKIWVKKSVMDAWKRAMAEHDEA